MTSSEQPESSLIHHRMVFMGTGIFTIRLLQTLLPVEKVSEHMAVPFLDINKPCHHRWMDIWPCPSWSLLKQMRVWNTPEVAVKGSIVQLSCRPKDSTVITDKFISVCLFRVHVCLLPYVWCLYKQAGDNLPESTVAAIFLVCLDSSFSVAYPLIHESAVAYLEQACFERYSLYHRVSRVSHCTEATCTFLKDAQAEVMIGNFQDRITCRISRRICIF